MSRMALKRPNAACPAALRHQSWRKRGLLALILAKQGGFCLRVIVGAKRGGQVGHTPGLHFP